MVLNSAPCLQSNSVNQAIIFKMDNAIVVFLIAFNVIHYLNANGASKATIYQENVRSVQRIVHHAWTIVVVCSACLAMREPTV